MFSAACRLSLVVASRGYPLVEVCGLRIMMASIVVEHGLSAGSDGKEFACNVGDLGSIPGWGKIPWRGERLPIPVFWPGECHGLYSPWGHKGVRHDWATFTFRVKALQSLGWEDPLEEGMATDSSILARRISWTEELGGQRIGQDWRDLARTE